MNKQITAVNPNGLSKLQLGEYVNQMARLERDIYALEETEKQLRQDIKNKHNEADRVRNQTPTTSLRPPRAPMSTVEKPTKVAVGRLFKTGGILALIFFIVSVIVSLSVMQSNFGMDPDVAEPKAALFGYIGSFIGFFCGIFINLIKQKRIIKQNMAENEENRKRDDFAYQRYLKELETYSYAVNREAQAFNDVCEDEAKKLVGVATACKTQADALAGKIAEMKDLRSKMYSVGIVPPDYRTMDCVYGLEYIFRNDLANTMRDAIENYEIRVYRGAVVKGMGAIVSRLDSLGTSMAYLTNEIRNVNNSVYSMRQEMVNLANQAVESNQINQKLLQESQATRYATQSMQEQMDYIYRTDYLHIT